MPEISKEQLTTLAARGATNRGIVAILGRPLTDGERLLVDRARAVAGLKKEKEKKERRTGADAVAKWVAERNAVPCPTYEASPRRLSCKDSLLEFMRTYLPHRFPLPFSPDHLTAIDRMQTAITTGGQFAQAAPRGLGKTEMAIAAVLWAILFGWRRFLVVVGADLDASKNILKEAEQELADNEMIAQDWPEVCGPIVLAFDRPNRSNYLTWKDGADAGKPCRVECKTTKLVLPTKVGVPTGIAGSIIVARGITGSLRGMRHTTASGKTIRPDFCLGDDLETDESARSPDQVNTREALLNGAIMGMAGPKQKIACVINGSVIRRDCLMDRLIDPKRHPEFRGVRFKTVYEFPKRADLWKEYTEQRQEGMRRGDGGAAAHAYYLTHRAEMDEGAVVGWEHRFRAGEVSAIECAFNIIADHGESTFLSEYNAEPKEDRGGLWRITPEQVASNLSGIPPRIVPAATQHLTLGCDINIKSGLHWTLTAWTSETAGYVVDYGKYPAGDTPLWTERSTISEEQAIFGGITTVATEVIITRIYLRQGTTERVHVDAAGFDCGYKMEAVFAGVQAMRGQVGVCSLFPVRGVTGKNYHPRQAVRKGDAWHVSPYGNSNTKTLFFNADTWRERTQRAFSLPPGCPGGSLSVYGSDKQVHERFSREVCAERIVDILQGDRLGTVYVWHRDPSTPNDWLDSTTYAVVAANYAGIKFGGKAVFTLPSKTETPEQTNAKTMTETAKPMAPKPTMRERMGINRRPTGRPGGFVGGWR